MPVQTLDPLLIQFYSTLEEMIKGYQQLMSILQKEKTLIIEGNSGELISCLVQKEGALTLLNTLEARRQQEIDVIGKVLGLSDHPLTFSKLIEAVREPFKSKFRTCKASLEALTSSMIEVNQMNGLLVDRTLRKISDLIGLLKQISAVPLTYSSTGQATSYPVRGKILVRT